MFTEGQEVYVNQTDSAHGIIEQDGERGVITHAGRIADGREQLVYVEWVDRPMRHQRNGSYRPYSQMWLSEDITWYKGFSIVHSPEDGTYGTVLGGSLQTSKSVNAVKRAIDNWVQA